MVHALMRPICFVCAWLLVGGVGFNILQLLKAGISHLKTLHQIPCSRCDFFTGDYHLKCTVHPYQALTEEAIGCRDYEPKESACRSCPARCSPRQQPFTVLVKKSRFSQQKL